MNNYNKKKVKYKSRDTYLVFIVDIKILQTPAHTRLDPPRSLDEATEWKRKVLDLMSLCWKPVEDRPAPNLLLRDLRAQVADYGELGLISGRLVISGNICPCFILAPFP